LKNKLEPPAAASEKNPFTILYWKIKTKNNLCFGTFTIVHKPMTWNFQVPFGVFFLEFSDSLDGSAGYSSNSRGF